MTVHVRRRGMIAFGLLPTMGAYKACLGLLVILVGSIFAARAATKRTICLSNLNGMGKACELYRIEHDDQYPPDLQALIKDGNDPRLFECPCSSLKGPSYFYRPPTAADDPSAMIACDYYCNHSDIHNVLFSDGHVQMMKNQRFAEALTWPVNAQFAQALAAAEGSLRAKRAARTTP
jgi:prepilin-type processing-associated H-X9-DG protein